MSGSRWTLACVFISALSGCAGPTTPLGAIWGIKPSAVVAANRGSTKTVEPEREEAGAGQPYRFPASGLWAEAIAKSRPRLRFDPPRQALHGPKTLKVIIEDPLGVKADYDFKVRYHGHDVTRSFLNQAKVSREDRNRRVILSVPSVRLSASTEHMIEIGYRNSLGQQAVKRYGGPQCRAFDSRELRSTADFKPSSSLIKIIQRASFQAGFNPAFTAALIAQESGFNPRTVSIARAVGLTQVTPIAEIDISGVFETWPRYPGINDYPAPLLKWMVLTGSINDQNEWRLSPEYSVRGGLALVKMLADRWQDSAAFSKIGWSGADGMASDVELARTRLILASYNSGYTRVLTAIHRYGAAWLTAPELKEARKYVNRVFSFCDAFQRLNEIESEVPNESET